MTLGEKIRILRKEKGMTQGDLAEKIQSTKQTIYKYENDLITNIPYEKLTILSNVLDTTPAKLVGWEDIAAEAGRKAAEEYMAELDTDATDEHELQLLQHYRSLNEEGQAKARERIQELTYIPEYQNGKKEFYKYVREIHSFMQEHDGNITLEDGERILDMIVKERRKE